MTALLTRPLADEIETWDDFPGPGDADGEAGGLGWEAAERQRDVLDGALSYAGLRMPVFPARGKTPYREGWQKRATDDPRKLCRLFSPFPDANVGLMMGVEIRPGEYVFTVDMDPRNGGVDSLGRLLSDLGLSALPPTASAVTGGARSVTGEAGSHDLLTAPFPVRMGPLDACRYPGIDIKGAGGLIIVAPSIHPETGREYRWIRHPDEGIAKAPDGLVLLLKRHGEPGKAGGSKRPARRDSGSSLTDPPAAGEEARSLEVETGGGVSVQHQPPCRDRAGDPAELAAGCIARFPVPGVGTRWPLMVKLVGSLVGRGYGDEMVRQVHASWYDHFDALGHIGTDKPEAVGELERCLGSTRANRRFVMSVGARDHRALCDDIVIDERLAREIRSAVPGRSRRGEGRAGAGAEGGADGSVPATRKREGQPGSSKGLTLIHGCRCDRVPFPLSEREFAFLEALLVALVHAERSGGLTPEGVVRLTNRQVMDVASDRHPEIDWSDKQFEREKSKFIDRPGDGKPATRTGLLQEVIKGDRPKAKRDARLTGTPSVYRVTGAKALVDLYHAHRQGDRRVDQPAPETDESDSGGSLEGPAVVPLVGQAQADGRVGPIRADVPATAGGHRRDDAGPSQPAKPALDHGPGLTDDTPGTGRGDPVPGARPSRPQESLIAFQVTGV